MAVISFTEKVRMNQGRQVMLYRGTDEEGADFFAYILCDAEGVKRMQADFDAGKEQTDISSYGHAIFVGFTPEPDADAELFLQGYAERMKASG